MTDKTVNIDVGDSRAGSVSIIYLLLSLGFIGWRSLILDRCTYPRPILGYDLTELKTPNLSSGSVYRARRGHGRNCQWFAQRRRVLQGL